MSHDYSKYLFLHTSLVQFEESSKLLAHFGAVMNSMTVNCFVLSPLVLVLVTLVRMSILHLHFHLHQKHTISSRFIV
jgi:hypothetical protein